MKLSSGKNSQILLLVALVAALLFAVYYYLVLPKQSEVDALNRSVSSIESEISTIQSSIDEKRAEQESASTNLFALGKKVPPAREVDKLLLNIEEIEYVTDSIVMGITFSDYDSSAADANIGITTPEEEVVETETEGDPNAEVEGDPGETTETTEGETVDDSASIISSLSGTLPPELKLISFNIEVLSPDYNRLLQFINELESLERIMHVDSISYSLPGEQAEFDVSEVNNVSATIQVTTFYYVGE